ncbi:MAG: phenylalanine--tRNA ligase beta subunit-related protein [Ignisphaera sp.]
MALSLCRELNKNLSVDDNAKSLGIFVSYTISWLEKEVSLTSYPFEDDVKNLLNFLKSRYSLESLKTDPIVRAYRDFFWRIGIDPTKTRPASEALVRRGLRGSFPRINPVVDAGNIASAYTMVPIGIYDLAYAKYPFKITISRGGEIFRPIGGGEEKLDKGVPILVDSNGLVMHIYPHRDSIETMVRESTKEVLVVGAGVPNVDVALVRKAVEMVVKLLEKIGWSWCGVIELK